MATKPWDQIPGCLHTTLILTQNTGVIMILVVLVPEGPDPTSSPSSGGLRPPRWQCRWAWSTVGRTAEPPRPVCCASVSGRTCEKSFSQGQAQLLLGCTPHPPQGLYTPSASWGLFCSLGVTLRRLLREGGLPHPLVLWACVCHVCVVWVQILHQGRYTTVVQLVWSKGGWE